MPVNRTPHLLRGHFPSDSKQAKAPGGSVLRGGRCHTLSPWFYSFAPGHSPGRCAAWVSKTRELGAANQEERGLSWTDMLSLASRNTWQPEGEEGEMMKGSKDTKHTAVGDDSCRASGLPLPQELLMVAVCSNGCSE